MNTQENLRLFRTNLINFRKEYGFTQNDLAESCNLSIRKYQRLESGEAVPTLEDLIQLSKALKVPVNFLLRYQDSVLNYEILSEEELVRSKQGEKLREFYESLKTEEMENLFESAKVFKYITQLESFQDSEIALICSEMTSCCLNKKAGEALGLPANRKSPFAELTKNRLELVGLLNDLLERNEYYLKFALNLVDSADPEHVICLTRFNKIGTGFWALTTFMK